MGTWLIAVPASHPCAAVEVALCLKRVPHRRIDLVPIAHRPVLRMLCGASTVPGLRFDDGEFVVGSRSVMRALERRVPAPALLGGPGVAAAEAWGEEVLQPVVRRVMWASLRRAPGALPSYAAEARPPVPALLARAVAPCGRGLRRREVAHGSRRHRGQGGSGRKPLRCPASDQPGDRDEDARLWTRQDQNNPANGLRCHVQTTATGSSTAHAAGGSALVAGLRRLRFGSAPTAATEMNRYRIVGTTSGTGCSATRRG
jgi:hypothetical protein